MQARTYLLHCGTRPRGIRHLRFPAARVPLILNALTANAETLQVLAFAFVLLFFFLFQLTGRRCDRDICSNYRVDIFPICYRVRQHFCQELYPLASEANFFILDLILSVDTLTAMPIFIDYHFNVQTKV